MNKTKYNLIKTQPVAKFFYKGQSHTHPVRRTVAMIENTPNYIRGFELREGAEVRIQVAGVAGTLTR